MKNTLKTFTLYVRSDENSRQIADKIRHSNSNLSNPLEESDDGDLIIAIGGDGTFIDSVRNMKFSKNKVFTGVHTGTLGFLQDFSPEDIYTLVNYIRHEEELRVRKVFISLIKVFLKNSTTMEFNSLNELLIAGENYSKITFSEHIDGEFLQKISGNGIIISTSTGDTAFNLNANGAIDFSNNFQLVCTPITPIQNAAYERFITNSIICTKIDIDLESSKNIQIIIDGKPQNIDSESIESVEVSMHKENYIQKLDYFNYSKTGVIRKKILGY